MHSESIYHKVVFCVSHEDEEHFHIYALKEVQYRVLQVMAQIPDVTAFLSTYPMGPGVNAHST